MALSAEDKEELKILIHETISDGCLCGHKDSVVHFFNRMEDIGSGNIKKGIEATAKTIRLFNAVRHGGEKIGGAIAVMISIAVVSGIGTLLWMGIKNYFSITGPKP